MKAFIFLLVVVCVGCGKKEQAKATPDAPANKLFVEAVQLITSAEEQTGEAAIKDYEQALAHLQNIISDYSESDLAVKLISGETLFTGKSLKEIKERVKGLKREAAESAVVATAPPPEKSIRQRFLDGELTKADYEKVRQLNLGRTKITDAGLKEVAKLQNLTYLDLSSTKITDAGLKELAKLKQLTWLFLGYTQITDEGLKEIAKLKQLTSLPLHGTNITDAGLKEVTKLQHLTTLILAGTKITDAGLKDVAKLKKLKSLNLQATQITDAGLKEVAKLQQLESLWLRGTKVTEAGVAELKKALPKCRIRSSDYN